MGPHHGVYHGVVLLLIYWIYMDLRKLWIHFLAIPGISWCCYDYDSLTRFDASHGILWAVPTALNASRSRAANEHSLPTVPPNNRGPNFSKLLNLLGEVPNISALYLIIWSCATSADELWDGANGRCANFYYCSFCCSRCFMEFIYCRWEVNP